MKKVLLIFLSVVFIYTIANSQIYRDTSIPMVLNGVLHVKGTYNPVPGAKIAIKGANMEVFADGQGFFVVPDMKRAGDTWMQISHEDFETIEMPVTIGGVKELGIIFMEPKQRDMSPITVNDLRAAGSDVSGQTFNEIGTSALLFGTGDYLVEVANYQLGILGVKLRGYDWKNNDVYFNGVLMNSPETGYVSPVLWDGLNDVLAKARGDYGLNSSLLFYGNIGGVSNMRIRPSEFRRMLKLSYGFSNSLYNHRVTATYSTGQSESGFSLLVAASGRLGNGFVKGTKFEGASYLVAIEKELDFDHSVVLSVAGAPTRRGMQNYSAQGVYDLVDDNFYNSAWGNDSNGKKKNSKINTFHQPVISLSHNWDINDWSLLRTTAGFTFGKNSISELLWTSNATDPHPDNYNNWTNLSDADNHQINWENILAANDTVPQYIGAKQYINSKTISLNSVYDNEISEKLVTTIGFQGRYYNSNNYRQLDDMLGAGTWLDIDKFVPMVVIPADYEQNDLNHYDRIVKKDDRIGYDYDITQMDFQLWNRWTMNWRKWNFNLAASVSYKSFWRNGNMKNGKYPDDSEGKSDAQNFFNFSVKGGASYPLGAGNLEAMGTYLTRAPQLRDAFILPQIANLSVEDLKSETVFGGELGYSFAGAFFSLRATGFYMQFNNQNRTRFYYDNDYQSQFSMSLKNYNQRHLGGELSMEMKLLAELTLKAAATYGVYKYTSDPGVTMTQQNMADIVYNDTVQMNGLYIGGTPQMAFTAGLLYNSQKKWWVGANINYAGNNYVDINPLRFDEMYASNSTQDKLKGALTLDLYGGYTFKFGEKYYLGLNVNAHNLLGTKKAAIGAYEPLAFYDSAKSENKYAANYAYAYGRTVFLIVSFRF